MDDLSKLSITVLGLLMTDCLMRMEGSTDVKYIEKQVSLFKSAENEVLSRGLRRREASEVELNVKNWVRVREQPLSHPQTV